MSSSIFINLFLLLYFLFSSLFKIQSPFQLLSVSMFNANNTVQCLYLQRSEPNNPSTTIIRTQQPAVKHQKLGSMNLQWLKWIILNNRIHVGSFTFWWLTWIILSIQQDFLRLTWMFLANRTFVRSSHLWLTGYI